MSPCKHPWARIFDVRRQEYQNFHGIVNSRVFTLTSGLRDVDACPKLRELLTYLTKLPEAPPLFSLNVACASAHSALAITRSYHCLVYEQPLQILQSLGEMIIPPGTVTETVCCVQGH